MLVEHTDGEVRAM